ncbi:hypothetical protein K501DRAFT_167334, partial [Backusella circina FSU 941]
TVKSILKNIKMRYSLIPLKGGGRPKKLDEGAERRAERLIREGPFITYKLLLLYLEMASIKVLRITIIACVQSVDFRFLLRCP